MYYYTVMYCTNVLHTTALQYCTVPCCTLLYYCCCTTVPHWTEVYNNTAARASLLTAARTSCDYLCYPFVPLSTCVTPGISHHLHPEGEPCTYLIRIGLRSRWNILSNYSTCLGLVWINEIGNFEFSRMSRRDRVRFPSCLDLHLHYSYVLWHGQRF